MNKNLKVFFANVIIVGMPLAFIAILGFGIYHGIEQHNQIEASCYPSQVAGSFVDKKLDTIIVACADKDTKYKLVPLK
jgi:hypothetical protein